MMKKYFAFFFDLMGHSRFLMDVTEELEHGLALSSETQERLNVIVHTVNDFLEFFRLLIVLLKDHPAVTKQVLSNGHPFFKEYFEGDDFTNAASKTECGFEQFSDSTLFYVDADSPIAGQAICLCIAMIAAQMPQLHFRDVQLRGCVSYGDAYKVANGHLCGPLVDSLELIERTVSSYSRVVLSNEMVQMCVAENVPIASIPVLRGLSMISSYYLKARAMKFSAHGSRLAPAVRALAFE